VRAERTVDLGRDHESDDAVVERALNAHLLGRMLDRSQSQSDLSEEAADQLAYGGA
jgi:hypothetical protein